MQAALSQTLCLVERVQGLQAPCAVVTGSWSSQCALCCDPGCRGVIWGRGGGLKHHFGSVCCSYRVVARWPAARAVDPGRGMHMGGASVRALSLPAL